MDNKSGTDVPVCVRAMSSAGNQADNALAVSTKVLCTVKAKVHGTGINIGSRCTCRHGPNRPNCHDILRLIGREFHVINNCIVAH